MNGTPGDAAASGDREGDASQDIVVFRVVDESRCRACGVKRKKKSFFRLEKRGIVCAVCIGIDHLVFLPRGDVALTRRASKHSTLRAIVVRFSRHRRRHERQGVLVEQAALERAKRECEADAPARERARERAAQGRAKEDERYIAEFAKRLGDLFPGCSAAERQTIAAYACRKYSDRVGRTAAAKRFEPEAIKIAVRSHIRHRHTPYEQLLARGTARGAARAAVNGAMNKVYERWQRPKR